MVGLGRDNHAAKDAGTTSSAAEKESNADE